MGSAHHRGFQRLSETWVLQTADGVEAHQITRQMETGDLLVALLGDGVAFDGPGTDRVQRLQLVAGLEQGLAFLDGLFLSIMLSSWSSSWALRVKGMHSWLMLQSRNGSHNHQTGYDESRVFPGS